MQKRDLVIFSLLVISVLFIAGCQEAVGGKSSSTINQASYTYRAGSDSLNVGVTTRSKGECNLLNGVVQVGDVVSVDSTESSKYLVVGCIMITAENGVIEGRNVTPTVWMGVKTSDLIRASQFSRALLLPFDQNVVTSERILSSSDVYVIRGSQAYTGF